MSAGRYIRGTVAVPFPAPPSARHPRYWRKTDVDVGQLWEHGGRIYRVIAIVEDPMVVLGEVTGSGDREHHVISSPLFAEWTRLDKIRPSR